MYSFFLNLSPANDAFLLDVIHNPLSLASTLASFLISAYALRPTPMGDRSFAKTSDKTLRRALLLLSMLILVVVALTVN
jgi:hypothetical protein